MPFRFPSSARLRRAGEFALMKREGRTFPGRYVVLSVLSHGAGTEPPRLGLITSRRVGGAVQRNRVRRHLREIFRLSAGRLRRGLWLVLIARAPAATADHHALQQEWERLARRSGIWAAGEPSAPAAP